MENSNTDRLIKALYIAGGAYCAMELVKVVSSWGMKWWSGPELSNIFILKNKTMISLNCKD